MTEIQLLLPINGLPSYEDSALPSYGEAIKLPSDYIKGPNDTYRLFTATISDSPTPWTITEMVTTAPGSPTPPSGRNRVHPDTTIDIDGEVEGWRRVQKINVIFGCGYHLCHYLQC